MTENLDHEIFTLTAQIKPDWTYQLRAEAMEIPGVEFHRTEKVADLHRWLRAQEAPFHAVQVQRADPIVIIRVSGRALKELGFDLARNSQSLSVAS